jgi:hypothetical protein
MFFLIQFVVVWLALIAAMRMGDPQCSLPTMRNFPRPENQPDKEPVTIGQ